MPWYSLADYLITATWYTLGGDDWYTLADYEWYTLADGAWYIIVRSLTGAATRRKPASARLVSVPGVGWSSVRIAG